MLSTVLIATTVLFSAVGTAAGAHVHTRAAAVNGTLRVTENSGVCETTSGVYQASGYGDISSDSSIWYVVFRSKLTGT